MEVSLWVYCIISVTPTIACRDDVRIVVVVIIYRNGSHFELLTTAIRYVSWVTCPYLTTGVFFLQSGLFPQLKPHVAKY